MLGFVYSSTWFYIHSDGFGKSEVPDGFLQNTYLFYFLTFFLLSFAIQYLSRLIFKRKWLQRLPSILLIVAETPLAILSLYVLIVGNDWDPFFLVGFIILSPFICIVGTVVAWLLHRWVIKRKEKKAQALNPAS